MLTKTQPPNTGNGGEATQNEGCCGCNGSQGNTHSHFIQSGPNSFNNDTMIVELLQRTNRTGIVVVGPHRTARVAVVFHYDLQFLRRLALFTLLTALFSSFSLLNLLLESPEVCSSDDECVLYGDSKYIKNTSGQTEIEQWRQSHQYLHPTPHPR